MKIRMTFPEFLNREPVILERRGDLRLPPSLADLRYAVDEAAADANSIELLDDAGQVIYILKDRHRPTGPVRKEPS